jgi:hypothetical protein
MKKLIILAAIGIVLWWALINLLISVCNHPYQAIIALLVLVCGGLLAVAGLGKNKDKYNTPGDENSEH